MAIHAVLAAAGRAIASGASRAAASSTVKNLPSTVGRAVTAARSNPIVNETFAPGSTGKPMAGLAGSAIRKTAAEMTQAVSDFGNDTAFSQNDAATTRGLNYTPFGPARPVQGPPIGIPHDVEHRYPTNGGAVQQTAPTPPTGAAPGSAQQPASSPLVVSPPTPVYTAPRVSSGPQYAVPGSAVYSKPPAGPYVQGMGDPFARRPQLGADPFAGSRSTYTPPEAPGKGANPFETPGANPFEVGPRRKR